MISGRGHAPGFALFLLAALAARRRLGARPGSRSDRAFLGRQAFLLIGVASEHARVAELAELVADHVLGDEHIEECTAVVDLEGVANELRNDGARARPSLDWLPPVGGVEPLDLSVQALNDVRTFFQ